MKKIEEKSPVRILFVCWGNICRSPAAENVMRHLAEQSGLADAFALDSAGTISLHTGNPPDPRMIESASRRGITMTGQARQIRIDDFHDFEWILVMDDENLADVESLARQTNGDGSARIARFCDFCTEHAEREVPDPYYGGASGFEKVLDLLEDGCAEIIRWVKDGQL